MEIINLEKKKLNYQQQTSKNYTKMQKIAIFVKKNLKIKSLKIKNIINLETTVIMLVNIEVLQRVYVI